MVMWMSGPARLINCSSLSRRGRFLGALRTLATFDIGEAARSCRSLDIAIASAAALEGGSARLLLGCLPERVTPVSLPIRRDRHPALLRNGGRGCACCAESKGRNCTESNDCSPDRAQHSLASIRVDFDPSDTSPRFAHHRAPSKARTPALNRWRTFDADKHRKCPLAAWLPDLLGHAERSKSQSRFAARRRRGTLRPRRGPSYPPSAATSTLVLIAAPLSPHADTADRAAPSAPI